MDKKKRCAHAHAHEYNSAIDTNKTLMFATMDGPRGYKTKWNKSERDKHHMISYTVEFKKQKK